MTHLGIAPGRGRRARRLSASQRWHRPMIWYASLILSGLLAACSAPDYSAVRDWGRTAGLATPYRPAAEPAPDPGRWPASGAGDDAHATPAIPGGGVPAPQANDILLMQQVLSVYLPSLATVASDGVLPYMEDPFTGVSARLAGSNRNAGEAVATLGALLRKASRTNMQAPSTGDFIRAADPAVQSLIAALSEAVIRLAEAEADERDRLVARYAWMESEAKEAARPAIRDLATLGIERFSQRADARIAYLALLRDLAQGHALLREESSHLSQEEVRRQIRVAEDRIRASSDLLPRSPWPASAVRQPSAAPDAVHPMAPPI